MPRNSTSRSTGRLTKGSGTRSVSEKDKITSVRGDQPRGFPSRIYKTTMTQPLAVQILGGLVVAAVVAAVSIAVRAMEEGPSSSAQAAGGHHPTTVTTPTPTPTPSPSTAGSPTPVAPRPVPAPPSENTSATPAAPLPSTLPGITMPASNDIPPEIISKCPQDNLCFWSEPDFRGRFTPIRMVYTKPAVCTRIPFTARSMYSNASQSQAYYLAESCAKDQPWRIVIKRTGNRNIGGAKSFSHS